MANEMHSPDSLEALWQESEEAGQAGVFRRSRVAADAIVQPVDGPVATGSVNRRLLWIGIAAALALAAILLVETGFSNAAINASIASSVFLVFVVPHSVASSTRRVVGGHIVGVLVGVAAYGILTLILDDPAEMSRQSFAIAGAASVGVSILLMALTNTEHPPSAGTTLSLVAIGGTVGTTYGTIFDAVWFIISAAIILALVRFLLRRWLVNLL